MKKESVSSKIIGSWKLISITYVDQEGGVRNFWGEKPEGMLTYTTSGHMNAQFMQSDRTKFTNAAFGSGAPTEIEEAFGSYQAYFGTYSEVELGVLHHQIQGCLFPNWSGITEVRYATIIDNKLTLRTPPTPVKDKIISVDALWEKLD